jgi:hypothetical protein
MWVLILAIASFLVFVSITLLLWLAGHLENRKRSHREELLGAEPFTFLSVYQAFEPVFSILWEGPIQALEITRRAGKRGIPVSRLRPIFAEAAKRFPEVYDGYTFQQCLQFMEGSELIQWCGQKAILTC